MNEKVFTIDEIKNYIRSQDSLGDVLYNLNEENIIKTNIQIVHHRELGEVRITEACKYMQEHDLHDTDSIFVEYNGDILEVTKNLIEEFQEEK